MQATFTGQARPPSAYAARRAGRKYDEENSLQYYGVRYLDNEVGRFVSIDPAVLVLHDSDKLKEIVNGDINDDFPIMKQYSHFPI